jgi:hypothetical protein
LVVRKAAAAAKMHRVCSFAVAVAVALPRSKEGVRSDLVQGRPPGRVLLEQLADKVCGGRVHALGDGVVKALDALQRCLQRR